MNTARLFPRSAASVVNVVGGKNAKLHDGLTQWICTETGVLLDMANAGKTFIPNLHM